MNLEGFPEDFCANPCADCKVRDYLPEVRAIIGQVMPLALKRSVTFEQVQTEVDLRMAEMGRMPTNDYVLRGSANIAGAACDIATGKCRNYTY